MKHRNKNTNSDTSGSIITESRDILEEVTKSIPKGANRGLFWDLIGSIFEPGVNPGLLFVIHISFITLFAVHLWLVYLTEGRAWYVWGLVTLNLILYPSLLAFISYANLLTDDNTNTRNKSKKSQ